MIISSQFFIETHVYLNHFSRDKFKNLDVDNKMSLSCGWEEPHSWPKMPFFISVISIYFVTFFFEHTVYQLKEWEDTKHKVTVHLDILKQFINNLIMGESM